VHPSAAYPASPALTDGHGLHVVSEKALDARLLAVTVSSGALPAPANVRILLPPGYARHPRKRYPVMYLLHGTSGGAADWTVKGDAEKTTAGRQLIVVMPDVALGYDGGGWCTNWWGGGAGGRPEWETFHIAELIPWVDHNLRTRASRGDRAIAGLSQGGFCSTSYAARHPDLFGTALSFSGAPDIAYDSEAQALTTPVINATEVGLDRVPPNSMFGDRATEELNWAAHDPTTLAANLRDTKLYLFTGNGQPGPFDSGPPDVSASGIEAGVARLTQLFHDRLDALGIPSVYDAYGPGTHSWPYWARDLRQSIGPVMAGFAHPRKAPRSITYTTAQARFSVFGWGVAIRRTAGELATLSVAGAHGFTLAGSGSARVTTPRALVPRTTYRVTLRGAATHATLTRHADRNGRLHIDVPLGPPNANQEYTAAAAATGTRVFTTVVRIRRLR
jgi:S-formylglutathione hydrolase FrmB